MIYFSNKKQFLYVYIVAYCLILANSCKKDSGSSNSNTSDSFTQYESFSGGPTLYSGWDLYSYNNSAFTSIRYSPSIMVHDDGSIDAWYTLPGGYDVTGAAFFNQISYIKSADQGKTWTEEKIVLRPTPGSIDQYYVRNPSVIKYGKYYFMTYESRTNGTTTASGSNNNIFVCRSLNPYGPWQKWNGTGWGGNPASVVKITPLKVTYYGVGETSLISKNDSVYLYYSLGKDSSQATRTVRTKALLTDSLWPGKITIAPVDTILKRNMRLSKTIVQYNNSDRVTIKYDKSKNAYYAFGVINRLTDSSYIQMWSSSDGLVFNELGKLKNGVNSFASMIGIASDSLGQWNSMANKYMSYSYGAASMLSANTYFNMFKY